MVGALRHDRDPRVRAATWIVSLLTAILVASGCATYRVPAADQTMTDAQRATCDEFARGEVRRLGESVPAALAKGFLTGLTLDQAQAVDGVSQALDGPHAPHSAGLLDPRLASWPLVVASGGLQLARDAARTNEDVYGQAIERCIAPVRLAEAFGPRDARVATSLELLADCYAWQHKYAQAEPLRREAVAIWEGVFGPKDQRVARALDNHATILRYLHREGEAASLSQRAAMIRAQIDPHTTSPAVPTPARSVELSCDSPLSATILILCRGIPRDPDGDWYRSTARP